MLQKLPGPSKGFDNTFLDILKWPGKFQSYHLQLM